ncbi:hypothetical protein [Paenibacillus pasadenensis]|uniref:hypothetical protein n=1 Tax=Paenibacillus pasadenensis TaxID=217090 RepID=UPI000C7A38C9|nr:hypothetical protein [Paenibacillus pasadenensis]
MEEQRKEATASTTKGFRTTEGTKARAEAALEAAGLPKGTDMLEYMASLVELQNMKTGALGYDKQLEELEYHTKRTGELFLSMIQTEGALRHQLTEDHAEKQAKASEQLHTAEVEIQELRSRVKAVDLELQEMAQTAEERAKTIKSLESVNEKNDELVATYRKEISELQGTVARQIEATENAGKLDLALQETKRKTAELEKQLQEEQKMRHEAELRNQEDAARNEVVFQERLDRAQEKAELQRQTELVQLRAQLQSSASESAEKRLGEIRDLYVQLAAVKDELSAIKEERTALQRELASQKTTPPAGRKAKENQE